ncbi:hypothetical protein [Mycoplasma miroungirhinis]|uniref:Uncharacterized protein n=1 Tax=Mycoplasma miroungirhinis TaxID=754516 RepID=A0A6M4JHP1_9MOLU|nr:hypothetical protein [Mycoplasma miroungirhinis]QJR43941.1 hypothetical protein HLA92_00565 [Mycoplasma miroungirhinis]
MEKSFIIAGIEFLAIVLMLLFVLLAKGYKECFSKDKTRRLLARSNKKEWKYLLASIIVDALGMWTLITYFIIKNSQ